MGKKFFLPTGEKLIKWSPGKELEKGKGIGEAILECLMDNDPEGVMEIVGIYLEALNKTKIREKSNLAKTTMFHALRNKNPTIKTLAKIMSAFKE